MIEFTIIGSPVPKGRPRASHKDGVFRVHTAKKTRNYEVSVAQIAAIKMSGRKPVEGVVSVSLYAYMPIPVSKPKKWKEAALRGDILPNTRPDIDNLAKSVLDAINGIVFKDDNQIADLSIKKFYSDRPRMKVVVHELTSNY